MSSMTSKLPLTSVTFHTTDADLQRLYDTAESRAAMNIVQFTPGMKILVEGAGYTAAWLETQPMGGEMYAKRNLEVALNNQIIFMNGQRTDARGVPVVTDLDGNMREVVGISPKKQSVTLRSQNQQWKFALTPNQIWGVDSNKRHLNHAVPFNYPYQAKK